MLRDWLNRAWVRTGRFFKPALVGLRHFTGSFTESKIRLSYFDEALAVELGAINARRKKNAVYGSFQPVAKLTPVEGAVGGHERPPSPPLPTPSAKPSMTVNPNSPDPERTRPRPVPCTAVGVALSGGGIRSAAFSLGALQALDFYGVITRTDYLSTVSGGGYVGACLTASMSQNGGTFPFGGAADVRDDPAIGHLRNYSNYLVPRARSALRNFLDVVSILLRGLLANALIVLAFLMLAAFLTAAAYPDWTSLPNGNFALRLAWVVPSCIISALNFLWAVIVPHWLADPLSWLGSKLGAGLSELGSAAENLIPADVKEVAAVLYWLFDHPFSFTVFMSILVAAVLIFWAWLRSKSQGNGNDVDSLLLRIARVVLALTILSAILDLQPLFIYLLGLLYKQSWAQLSFLVSSPVIAGAVTIALFARRLGAFLETTEISALRSIRAKRFITQVSLIVAGLVLPLVLLVIYWHLSAWLIDGGSVPKPFSVSTAREFGFLVLIASMVIMWSFEANAYSLHQFYKDRLSKAFLFEPQFTGQSDPRERPRFKLSDIETIDCPYHIINAALNVQGSKEANRRGRNADFFSFTHDFVGSDLTHFAMTRSRTSANDMETVDPQLDLGAAMAISGAALSANMGSNTVRWLSPTLALLNIRLGYWLRNPRDLGKQRRFLRPREWLYNFFGKFYLLLEMFNFLDENNKFVYLSDGGHIENLGIYQLLKRGCQLIIVIDAEADPEISCSSLLKLERYARIDLGIRIILPWEQIRSRNHSTSAAVDPRTPEEPRRKHGPHCALGPILYEDGSRGILLYFKSSLSGDEKDYILDYKKRNRDFPHETTGDQFFTEEQFEVYRSLGYHVVDGYFSNTDEVSWLRRGRHGWASLADAKEQVASALKGAQA